MRHCSPKTRRINTAARPVREALILKAGRCEICGASPDRPHRGLPKEFSALACHEIACGKHRLKALDKPYAILVLCWKCNSLEVTSKGRWPEARQLAVLKANRPADYDLEAYNFLVNPRAPNRITHQEVYAHMETYREDRI